MGQGKRGYADGRGDKRDRGFGGDREYDGGRSQSPARDSYFDRQPSFDGPRGRPVRDEQPGEPVVGQVKRFFPDKGFGFVTIPGKDDAFLHASKLDRFGGEVEEGASIECHVRRTQKGFEVASVEVVGPVTAPIARPQSASRPVRQGRPNGPVESVRLPLKNYNSEKGFGFFDIEPGRSIFSHVSAFEAGGVNMPVVGETYLVEYAEAERGPKAVAVRKS